MFSQSTSDRKIITKTEFKDLRNNLKKQGKKIIHCHGVFDLLHPGHIAHFEQAKALGDILVVSITSSNYVNKGPGRPYFSDELRVKSLAALSSIDYVMLSEGVTPLEIIEVIQPDLYVKGSEYENFEDDVTQNIEVEVEKVRSLGGDVYFTKGPVFSSTKIINNEFNVFPHGVKEYAKQLSAKYSFEEIKDIIDKFSNLKVLVVGDIIIDEYVFCNVQGLMSKDRAFSSKYLKEDRYLGGSLAVANHIAGFTNNVTVCGIVGDEAHIHSQILNDLSKVMYLDLCFDSNFRTVVKRRYVEKLGKREEYNKIFSINYFMDEDQEKNVDWQLFYNKLNDSISNYDIVILTDYGHGLINQTAMDIIQEKSKFLALNCQTNSSNYGTNSIMKYRHADTFTLDERELKIAFNSNSKNYDELFQKLSKHLGSSIGWLTLGSVGAKSIDLSNNIVESPALTLTVTDTVGAGGAYFALASLCAKLDVPPDLGTFIGNIAGAIAANVLGNSKSVNKVDLLKFASTLLNV